MAASLDEVNWSIRLECVNEIRKVVDPLYRRDFQCKKVTLALVFALLMVLAIVDAAGVIANGQPDGSHHPYVGLVVFDDEKGPAWRCNASLLTDTVLLTVGSCTDGAVAARVWFDEVVKGNPEYPKSGATSYDGIPNTYPGFCIGCGNGLPGFAAGDVGIVVLSEPVPTSIVSRYADLLSEGLVDTLANKTSLNLVGYGVQEQFTGGGPPVWSGLRVRLFAPTELVSGEFTHSDQFMKIALNPGGGSGGTCFGDSGGPDTTQGTNSVLAVNSYLTNSNCTGVGYSYRIDTPEELAWINGFLP